MGMYSEKTQRQVDQYFRRLVRRMPTWLRLLFDEDRVFFEIQPSGELQICIDSDLDERTKGNAQTLIHRYMTKHQMDFIKRVPIN